MTIDTHFYQLIVALKSTRRALMLVSVYLLTKGALKAVRTVANKQSKKHEQTVKVCQEMTQNIENDNDNSRIANAKLIRLAEKEEKAITNWDKWDNRKTKINTLVDDKLPKIKNWIGYVVGMLTILILEVHLFLKWKGIEIPSNLQKLMDYFTVTSQTLAL